MRRLTRKSENKKGFTIVEILTVMSIIVILIGILVPSLNMVRRYANDVKQKAQFHAIDAALELFKNEFDGYPDSSTAGQQPDYDETGNQHYPGAARLCEAMLGQDLLGFHRDSRFRADCTNGNTGEYLYANQPSFNLYPDEPGNLQARVGPYLPLEKANAYRFKDIYGSVEIGDTQPELFVLCDEYARVKNKNPGPGKRVIGMPILYYKANTAGERHDPNETYVPEGTNDEGQFYNYLDNDYLVGSGMPWNLSAVHPLHDPEVFYGEDYIRNERITAVSRPYRADSYILISAGFDGQYGTTDDKFNFEK